MDSEGREPFPLIPDNSERPGRSQPISEHPASKRPPGRPTAPAPDADAAKPVAADELAALRAELEEIRAREKERLSGEERLQAERNRLRNTLNEVRRREWPKVVAEQRALGNYEAVAKRDDAGKIVRDLDPETGRPLSVPLMENPPADWVPENLSLTSKNPSLRALARELIDTNRG